MPVGIAAALIFILYLSAVPVKLALKIRTSPAPAFGAGIAVFERRFALRQAEKRISGEKKHLPWKKFAVDAQKLRMLRALKYILPRIKIEKLVLTGSISSGDAAGTALICGSVNSIGAALEAIWPEGTQIFLQSDFSGKGSALQFSGMVSLRAGHIILAALIGAVEVIKGRISQWKSTRLKIS